MKSIELEFSKLEFGTKFIDPATGLKYIKISDNEAEIEDDGIMRPHGNIDNFGGTEIVIFA